MGDTVNRRTLLRAGLTAGLGVAALGATVLAAASNQDMELQAFDLQSPWRHCKKCQGLSWGGGLSISRCPAGGKHIQSGSLWYFLRHSEAPPTEPSTVILQDQWRHCKNCQGLAYNGSGVLGWCPAGGHHNHTGSYNYYLHHDTGTVPVYNQNGWRYCAKCAALFYGPGQATSWCGQSGQHSPPAYPNPPSFDYIMQYSSHSPVG
jgi:hypothetical protein